MGNQLSTVHELKIKTVETKRERQVKKVKIHCHLRFTVSMSRKNMPEFKQPWGNVAYNTVYLALS